MKITILTLFPQMFDGFLSNSIIKRAIEKNTVEIRVINIRNYTLDKYGRVDTPPVGGGAGLIMKCQPIVDAIDKNTTSKTHKILLSPRGKQFNQKRASEYAREYDEILFVCGHYEGVDERVNKYVDELVSIGDFILTGGELGAMVVSDAIIRLLDGAISAPSLEEETFESGLLEYPQYTEPYDYRGSAIPDILYCGNHTAIKKYRRKESLKLTLKYRPDLFAKHQFTKEDTKLLKEIENNINEPKWLVDAINKGQKFIKKN